MLNNIDSPLQAVRDIFDLMATDTADDWATGAQRLAAVPTAIDGYIASLRLAASRGQVRARRQVEIAIKQCGGNVGPDGFFGSWARTAATAGGASCPGRCAPTSPAMPSARRTPTPGSRRSCATSSSSRPASGRRSAVSGTRSTRDASSARRSTWTRPTRGDRRSWPASTPRWRRPPGGSAPARRWPKRSRRSTPIRPGCWRAPRHCRPGCRRSPTRRSRRSPAPTSTSPSRSAAGVPDRPDQHRRHLLHRAQRRPGHPSRPDVVVGADGCHLVRDVEGTHDRLPRGRPRTSPADRTDRLPPRPAQPLAAARVVDQRVRRGVGAVRRAADGRARLPGRPGRLPGAARLAVAARGAGGARHRHPLRARGAGVGRWWRVDV